MKQYLTLAATFIAALTLTAPAARAQTVYDNGSFVGAGDARNISDFAAADDLSVTGSLTFNAIRFYAIDLVPGLLGNFDGTLSWFLYDSSGTTPNATPGTSILASGSVNGSSVTVANTGQNFAGNEIAQLDFGIPSQTLTTGNYWLRIKEGTPTANFDGTAIFWMQTGGARTGNGYRNDPNETAPTAWNDSGTNTTNDLSYQLRNNVAVVPEASSLALLLPALAAAGTVVVRRRRAA